MKKLLLLLVPALFFGISCGDEGGGASAEEACTNFESVCPDIFDAAFGDQATCVSEASGSGTPQEDLDCVAAATSCDDIEACVEASES